jgi:hypothetical protein
MSRPPRAAIGWFSSDYVKEAFRPHPDISGAWLYKEDWPLGGIWNVGGETRIESAGHLLTTAPLDAAFSTPPLLGYVLLAWMRRNWLKEHAERVPKELWWRATSFWEGDSSHTR